MSAVNKYAIMAAGLMALAFRFRRMPNFSSGTKSV